ncbi:helix-turn-helix domain-containing protein [Sphingomonas changbaiensis]|uniref:helix-turn-helix domain-containing protein n=1 Tax=Sphingomonas changbaiensis TaxID=529705 RepID=UPI001470032A|nr:AraC family transcriptional regulator [Sphingomonas changbaiensis]
MRAAELDRMLERLEVRLDAFAICEIESGCGLRCDPFDRTIVHFVLQGCGMIEWSEAGRVAIRPGMIIVVPKRMPKQINGEGPVQKVFDANEVCPLAGGMVKFRACRTKSDLILGCASVDATIFDRPNYLDQLSTPVSEHIGDGALSLLFKAMLAELSSVGVGTRAIVSAIMKQLMVMFLRRHLERSFPEDALSLLVMDQRLRRVASLIVDRPGEAHSLESLARIAGMSRSRFSQLFLAAYGESPTHFLSSARLTRAARLLEDSSLPIKAVAGTIGYASRSHFSRVFRERYGVDPSQFREAHRQGIAAK